MNGKRYKKTTIDFVLWEDVSKTISSRKKKKNRERKKASAQILNSLVTIANQHEILLFINSVTTRNALNLKNA